MTDRQPSALEQARPMLRNGAYYCMICHGATLIGRSRQLTNVFVETGPDAEGWRTFAPVRCPQCGAERIVRLDDPALNDSLPFVTLAARPLRADDV